MTATPKAPIGAPAAESAGHGFGTAPVFLASPSTILGAILYLRHSKLRDVLFVSAQQKVMIE